MLLRQVTPTVTQFEGLFVQQVWVRASNTQAGTMRYEALPAGAVTYAAAVTQGLRERACIVTTAGNVSDAAALAGHEAHVLPTSNTLTFRHTYTWFGNNRKLQVPLQPDRVLTAADVPLRCRLARVLLIGPLTPTDVDVESFTQPKGLFFRFLLYLQDVGLMAQVLPSSAFCYFVDFLLPRIGSVVWHQHCAACKRAWCSTVSTPTLWCLCMPRLTPSLVHDSSVT
jgi:hypothetical protein